LWRYRVSCEHLLTYLFFASKWRFYQIVHSPSNKEDAHTLFGFIEKSEEIFKLLLSVSGIGANIARTMLSSLDPKQITNAIASADVVTIQSIKGIGSKTAQG
jgi:Holliday junction resolvasome RuvABC DNA-binding subunit